VPDIGFLELLLIGAIAFLVLGPERMPKLFGQIGCAVRKGRGWIADVRRQIDAETAPLKQPLHEVEQAANGIDDYNAAIMKELGETLTPDPAASRDKRPAAEAPKPEHPQQ
jgi:sec-independent protein translocase protein TatB